MGLVQLNVDQQIIRIGYCANSFYESKVISQKRKAISNKTDAMCFLFVISLA